MKANRFPILILGIGLIVMIAVFTGITPWRTDFWQGLISFAALLFAAAICYQSVYVVSKVTRKEETVAGFLAVVVLRSLYALAVIFHIVFFWMSVGVSLYAYILIHLITLAIWAMGTSILLWFNGYVRRQEEHTEALTRLVKQMQLSLRAMKQQLETKKEAEYGQLKAELQQLSEKVRFSDPLSSLSMKVLEDNLLWQMEALEQCVQLLIKNEADIGNVELSRKLIADITNDLSKRNSQLVALK
ncbi:hypothetical protein [Paenibacillus sp. N3.4]|uniref:hypothetical protein n=1 Tax=Paenibacillus sp. N3.4 TaxID=2603222 RepID=UPI0011C76572|nr:hypothetical protein [Paenibacillus sp. N3.4]TXK81441.1 hypothetical protein FU659_16205 [Paenibacillus sp. N3.4]